jgi:hypothetical protein
MLKFSNRIIDGLIILVICLIVILLLLNLFWPSLGHAGVKKAAKFGGGIIAAYALHEAGHEVAARLTNNDIDWQLDGTSPTWRENIDNDTDGLIVHSAGLLTQIAVSEIILQSDINKNDSFVRGAMLWNIFNPIVYAIDYWFIRQTNYERNGGHHGDIEGVEKYTTKAGANIFAVGMAALAAVQGYRYIKTQDWAPEWMQRDDMRLNLRSCGRKAMALMVEIDF